MLNRSLKLWQAIVLTAAVTLLAVTGSVAARGNGRVNVAADRFSVGPHAVVEHHVKCDRGTDSLGGGVKLDDPAVEDVRGTYPWEDEYVGSGWVVEVKNDSDQTRYANVYATCG